MRAIAMTGGFAHPSEGVLAALAQPLLDHRGEEFAALFGRVREALSALAGRHPAAIFCGSGTLANEVVAATLTAARPATKGLILVNGEFGERLARHAQGARLEARVMAWPWGQPWNLAEVASALAPEREVGWVWAVHLESSTGMLNDTSALSRLAAAHEVLLCLDCVSSLGAVPLDLSGVALATGVANKSLGSVPGLSAVFAKAGTLPRLNPGPAPPYLDLAASLREPGPRFTMSSPLLRALDAALEPYRDGERRAARFTAYRRLGQTIRRGLAAIGLPPLARGAAANPVITTFRPPGGLGSLETLRRLAGEGFLLGGASGYLERRGWLQIATMGSVGRLECERALSCLGACSQPPG